MLSTGAFNALLKTLEEPPENVIFILATTEPQKLPATILSRCMRLDFRRIPQSVLAEGMKKICTEKGIEIKMCIRDSISPGEYAEINSGNPKAKVIGRVYEEYQKQLRANNAMDFDDLLVNALHVLQQDRNALKSYQERFEYIMVDEYQDTNHIQYEKMCIRDSRRAGTFCAFLQLSQESGDQYGGRAYSKIRRGYDEGEKPR